VSEAENTMKMHRFPATIGRLLAKIGGIFSKTVLVLDDILVLAGVVYLIDTNFRANYWLGRYSLSAALIGAGLVVGWMLRKTIKPGGNS
jgi:hypothetical protein